MPRPNLVALVAGLVAVAVGCADPGPGVAGSVELPSGTLAEVSQDELDAMIEVVDDSPLFRSLLFEHSVENRRVRANILSRLIRLTATRLELDAQTLDIDPDEVASLREQIVGQITRELVYTDALEPRVEADRLSVRMEPFIAMVIESGAGAATLMNVRGIDMDEILAAATVEVDPEIGTWRADVLRITTPVGQSPSIQSDGDR